MTSNLIPSVISSQASAAGRSHSGLRCGLTADLFGQDHAPASLIPQQQPTKRKKFADERDLWPVWFDLIEKCKPREVFGEQVDDNPEWIDRMHADMEAAQYIVGANDLPACSNGAPQIRMRSFFVAYADGAGFSEQGGAVAMEPEQLALECAGGGAHFGDHHTPGELGRLRRVKPGIRLLADGLPGRVGILRGLGNAIDPTLAALFVRAHKECLA